MTTVTFTDKWELVCRSRESESYFCWLFTSAFQDTPRPERSVALLTDQSNGLGTYRIFEGESHRLPEMLGGRIVKAYKQGYGGGLYLELDFLGNSPPIISLDIEPALPGAVYPWRGRQMLVLQPLSPYNIRFADKDQCVLEVKKRR